jgi:hypothetical protein
MGQVGPLYQDPQTIKQQIKLTRQIGRIKLIGLIRLIGITKLTKQQTKQQTNKIIRDLDRILIIVKIILHY